MNDFHKSAFANGVKDSIPIFLGYISVSFTFGIMATKGGLPAWAAMLISMTNLTSAGQVAGTGLIISGGSFIEIAITTFIINIRYMLMSLSMSQKIDNKMSLPKRMLISCGITDEIFAVTINKSGNLTATYILGLTFLPYFGWAGGTLMGSLSAEILPVAFRSAFGIAIYGMFISFLIPAARKVKPVLITILIAVIISCIFKYAPILKTISSGWAIIISAVTAAALVAIRYPVKEQKE